MNYKIELCTGLDELVLEDTEWLTLGQLRALVAEADRCGWSDKSLVSHGEGAGHMCRYDIREARVIVITGGPPAIG